MTNSKLVLVVSLTLSVVAIVLSGTTLLTRSGATNVGQQMSTDFETQVRSYLLDNPGIIIESVQRFEEQQQVAEENELQTALVENAEEIFSSPTSPAIGDSQGDVTIVEFFDYNCPYCRKAAPMLVEAVRADPKLKIVLKEWPILGPGSLFAARAALASQAQGKYEVFHKAMMAHSGSLDENAIMELAGSVGLDVEQLKRDMEEAAIQTELDRNFELANALRISGTPTFVIGDEILRGLADLPTLQQYVAEARNSPEIRANGSAGE